MPDDTAPDPSKEKTPEKQIIAAAKIGMPWKVIARLVKMSLGELNQFRDTHPDLARDVLHAQAGCMNTLLEQLNEVKQWQAMTFILESRWPEHFGRNRKVKKKRAVEPDPSEEMLNSLTPDEFRQFRKFVDKMHAVRKAANARNNHLRSLRGPHNPPRLCDAGVDNP